MKEKFSDLPFFDEALIQSYVHAQHVGAQVKESMNAISDLNQQCKTAVHLLAKHGVLDHSVARTDASPSSITAGISVRSLCLNRQALAEHHALADFAYAMQGLGSGPIALAGTAEQKEKYLAPTRTGKAIAAFALSEPEAGSDAAALQCEAILDGDHYILTGYKTWISNGGIADYYCVFARTDPSAGARGISAFIVDANTPGFSIDEQIDVMAPHPIARLKFDQARIPVSQRIGAENEGFKIAMRTLDIFRCSVAAAAIGFAKLALETAIQYAKQRAMFGQHLIDFQLTQAAIGEMATQLDQAVLLTYRAAWLLDVKQRKTTLETAMAKLSATEYAQQIIDRCLQLLGGQGLVKNSTLERLYRDIRALRIYEGATEVQKLIIARQVIQSTP